MGEYAFNPYTCSISGKKGTPVIRKGELMKHHLTEEKRLALVLENQFLLTTRYDFDHIRLEYVIPTEVNGVEGYYTLLLSTGYDMLIVVHDVPENYCKIEDYFGDLNDLCDFEYNRDAIDDFTLEISPMHLNSNGNIHKYSRGRIYNIFEKLAGLAEELGTILTPQVDTAEDLIIWIDVVNHSDYYRDRLNLGEYVETKSYPKWAWKLITHEIADNLEQNWETLSYMFKIGMPLEDIFAADMD